MGREAPPSIMRLAPQASCRHGRVTSNVRAHGHRTVIACWLQSSPSSLQMTNTDDHSVSSEPNGAEHPRGKQENNAAVPLGRTGNPTDRGGSNGPSQEQPQQLSQQLSPVRPILMLSIHGHQAYPRSSRRAPDTARSASLPGAFRLKECALTLRSTRRPPATRQGREAVRPIIGLAALALRWWPRVTSNVRHQVERPRYCNACSAALSRRTSEQPPVL